MSSSGPMLVRLQELKVWQGNYDNILQSKIDLKTNQTPVENNLQNVDQTAENSTLGRSDIDWDGKEIVPTKPFEQLLEEKLAEQNEPINDVKVKPKKPFLKKGSGLVRYNLKSLNLNGRKLHNSSANRMVTDRRYDKTETKMCVPQKKEDNIDITPLKVPNIAMRPKAAWLSASNVENKFQNVQNKDAIASELSDCLQYSNLLTNLPMSGYKLSNPLFKPDFLNNINKLPFSEQIDDTAKSKFFVKTKPVVPSSNRIHPQCHGEQTLYEQALEKELKIFEALEEKCEDSSFCSTNSSVLRILSSTPNKSFRPEIVRIAEEASEDGIKKNENDNLQRKLKEVHHKTEFLNNFLSKLKKISEPKKKNNSLDANPDNILTNITDLSFSDDEKWSDNTSSHSTSPTDFDEDETGKIANKTDVAVNTSFDEIKDTDGQNCKNCVLLQKKILQYTKQIPDILKEKTRVCDYLNDLEKKRDQLSKDISKMKKKHDEEVKELNDELKKERNKFAKEKQVFEMYMKDSQNRSNKKDREEISKLKSDLSDIQELLKLKDSKNGATQARLRNQIKMLEKENSELKKEVDKLRKENAKLSANQKTARRPSETKMLQEINKNLSKLAEETRKIQVVSVDTTENEKKNINETKKQEKKTILKSNTSIINSDKVTEVDQFNEVTENLSLEKQYKQVFGEFDSPSSLSDSRKERTEVMLEDGSKEIRYSNGNVKTISADGNLVILKYYNGDIKQVNLEEKILKYYYGINSTWHTQFKDGSELIEFSNGQSERRFKDGKCEINYPDGVKQTINPDGSEEATYPDGSKLFISTAGERTLHLPNGQKEIHTKDEKRREYPDGTVKILYPDGRQETKYPNGRIRVKDANGTLIMDTESSLTNVEVVNVL